MQKKYLVGLALMLGAASYAGAQNNVSVYGSVDAGVNYATNERGGHSYKMDSGNRSPDRIGFRGVEDLGGGNKALFVLENGFNIDDGTMKRSGVLFNRAAYVGLSSQYGTATLGHIPDFLYEYLRFTSSAFLGSAYFFHPGNLDNLANQFQIDNAIKYESPNFGGFTLGAMNGFGEQAGEFNRNRSYSFGARYIEGPARLAAAYTVSNNRALNLGATLGLRSLLGQTLSANPAAANATYANFNATRMRSAGITGAYAVGMFLPHAMYSNIRIENARGSATHQNAEIGADVKVTPADTIGVSYLHSRFEDNRWNQLNLIGMHALSKRSSIYAAAAYQRAGGAAEFAVINSVGPARGQSQAVFRVGVHHLF